MSMTKKDYELIAQPILSEVKRLAQLPNSPMANDQYMEVTRLADLLADSLQADNPKFDRTLFQIACGFITPG